MGKFVVIEGLDGAGTTTQLLMLKEALEGRGQQVLQTHEPTGLPVGKLIRQTLQKAPDAVTPLALPWMFAADRCDHLQRVVQPALEGGKWVLSDRYYHSTFAYQSLDYPLDWVMTLNQTFRAPDLTLFVRVSVDTALERIMARGEARELFEERAALQTIAAQYDDVMGRLQARGEPITVVDGGASREEVHRSIMAAIQAGGLL